MYIKIIYILTKSNNATRYFNGKWKNEGKYNHQTYYIVFAYTIHTKP